MRVSYHWLWLVPRELATRSRWNVPYHDGIRTELGAPVPPGGRVALEARLLAPSAPGIYWLQWDMVEEGVTWFAQVSPRQPRQLVVVLPAFAEWCAMAPLLIAIAGIVALGAQGRLGRGGIRPSPAMVALIASADVGGARRPVRQAGAPGAGGAARADGGRVLADRRWPRSCRRSSLMLVLPRRARGVDALAGGVFGTLRRSSADVVYYRFFGDVMSAPALLAAHQTGHVLGIDPQPPDAGICSGSSSICRSRCGSSSGCGGCRRSNGCRAARARLAAAAIVVLLAVAGAALSAPRVLASSQLDQIFRDRAVVEQLGPFGFHAYDAWSYVRATLLRPAVDRRAGGGRRGRGSRTARRCAPASGLRSARRAART